MSAPGPVHLVSADDPVLRDTLADRLVHELLAGEDRSLAVEDSTVPGRARADDGDPDATGAGSEGVVSAVITALASPPFLVERRIVVVREIGNLTPEQAGMLAGAAAAPLPGVFLVLVTGGGRVPARLGKVLKELGVPTHAPTSEAVPAVLAAELRSVGLHLTPAAAERVATHLGDDAGRVPELVHLWSSSFGEGATLDLDDVEPYLGEAGGVPRYELSAAIDRGDVAGALEVLQRLLRATSAREPRALHPLQVMATLVAHYQRMLRLDDPAITSEREAVVALGGGVKPYPARKAMEGARRLGRAGLREAFGLLARAELDLRGAAGVDEQTVIEVLVARLAALSRRHGASGRTPRR